MKKRTILSLFLFLLLPGVMRAQATRVVAAESPGGQGFELVQTPQGIASRPAASLPVAGDDDSLRALPAERRAAAQQPGLRLTLRGTAQLDGLHARAERRDAQKSAGLRLQAGAFDLGVPYGILTRVATMKERSP